MKIQRCRYFGIAIALFMLMGLLPLSAALPISVTPSVAVAAEAETDDGGGIEFVDEEGSAVERTIEEIENELARDAEDLEYGSIETTPTDIGEGMQEIEAIDAELEEDAEEEDEGTNWLMIGVVVVALIASGAAAFFIASKQAK